MNNEKFIVDENTIVVAQNLDEQLYIITNDNNKDTPLEFRKGYIVDSDFNILSPLLPIGVLIKDDRWENTNKNIKDL